jgi:hypothetical protein
MHLDHLEGTERGLGLEDVLRRLERRVGPMIMVNGELASVHYFATEYSMFSARVTPPDGLDPKGSTELFGLGDYYSFMNTTFLSPTDLRRVVEDYARSPELPRSIEWDQLT